MAVAVSVSTRFNSHKKLDLAAYGPAHAVSRVAGMGERAVRERKNYAAVAGAMTVDHVITNHHRQFCIAGPDVIDDHAEHSGAAIVLMHCLTASMCERLTGWIVVQGRYLKTWG